MSVARAIKSEKDEEMVVEDELKDGFFKVLTIEILKAMGMAKTASAAVTLLIDIGYLPVHVNLDLLKLSIRTDHPDEIVFAAESPEVDGVDLTHLKVYAIDVDEADEYNTTPILQPISPPHACHDMSDFDRNNPSPQPRCSPHQSTSPDSGSSAASLAALSEPSSPASKSVTSASSSIPSVSQSTSSESQSPSSASSSASSASVPATASPPSPPPRPV
nr:ribonuclease II, chloroplastic/mitochondrial-like [Ipomoea batatas]